LTFPAYPTEINFRICIIFCKLQGPTAQDAAFSLLGANGIIPNGKSNGKINASGKSQNANGHNGTDVNDVQIQVGGGKGGVERGVIGKENSKENSKETNNTKDKTKDNTKDNTTDNTTDNSTDNTTDNSKGHSGGFVMLGGGLRGPGLRSPAGQQDAFLPVGNLNFQGDPNLNSDPNSHECQFSHLAETYQLQYQGTYAAGAGNTNPSTNVGAGYRVSTDGTPQNHPHLQDYYTYNVGNVTAAGDGNIIAKTQDIEK
jgi:hypothetical protein